MKVVIELPENWEESKSKLRALVDAFQDAKPYEDFDFILDKITKEIKEQYGDCDLCEYYEDYDFEENDISSYNYVASITDILDIINAYKDGR